MRHPPGHVLVVLGGVEGAVEGREVQVTLLGRDLPPLVRPPLPVRLGYPGDDPGHGDKLVGSLYCLRPRQNPQLLNRNLR